jgi:DNA-binding beta-propeller fold protein YncE/mono/diheme cytochrome c family protein
MRQRRHVLLALSLLAAGCDVARSTPVRPVPAPPPEPTPSPVIAPAEPAPLARDCGRHAPAARVIPISRTAGALALAKAGDRSVAFVADEDERALRTIDLASGAEIAFTPLDAAPGQTIVTADGRLVVALRGGASLALFEPAADLAAPLEHRCSVPVAAEPFGLAISPDGARLLVTSRWGHALSAFDLASLDRVFELPLPRDPSSIVISRDGRKAFVSHVVGARLSMVDLATSAVQDVDLHQVESPGMFSIRGSTRWTAGQGYTLVRTAEGRILAPEILANPNSGPDSPPSGGYGPGGAPAEIGDVAVLDEATGKLSKTPVLDVVAHTTCLLPRAAAIDEARGLLLVACLGEGVHVFDARAKLPHLAPLRRLNVPAGPVAIALDESGGRAIVWSQFARSLSVLDLAQATNLESHNRPLQVFALPRHRSDLDERVALGRVLFHDAGSVGIAGDRRACASCHPDGRDDGLTWSTPDGPRQTPILAARLDGTAPYSWDGSNADLESHVRRTLRRLFGAGLSKKELDALLAYLTHMEAPSVPAARTPLVAAGEAIFKSSETGCADCHDGARTTDTLRHDVASKVRGDRTREIDTPSLKFVGRSAPYFHDGRYATLEDLLRGVDGTMGHTKHLNPDQLKALSAYLEVL